MEEEKIIYFYPEHTKKRFGAEWFPFRRTALRPMLLDENSCKIGNENRNGNGIRSCGDAEVPEFSVIGCAVPVWENDCLRGKSHRRAELPAADRRGAVEGSRGAGGWNPRRLTGAMEDVLRSAEGMTDTYLHPQVVALLPEAYRGRFLPTEKTLRLLAGRLTGRYAADALRQSGEATLLLGKPEEADRQMRMAGELLMPYLPRVNRLLIFCEEAEGMDIWQEFGSYLDEYYYEYGLVPQLEPYRADRGGSLPRCGGQKCGGMVLDFAEGFRYPKIPPDQRAVYVDIASDGEKESFLRRKTPQILYVSPSKYLDTMVKSSYDSVM